MESEFPRRETTSKEEIGQAIDPSAQVANGDKKPLDFYLPPWSWIPEWRLKPERRKLYGTGR